MLYKFKDANTVTPFLSSDILTLVSGSTVINPTDELLIEYGYKPLIEAVKPLLQQWHNVVPLYQDSKDAITNVWQSVRWSNDVIITTLKAELTDTDYKIIKCAEYQLAGLPAPYAVAELHNQRQTIRDRINELETTTKI